LTLNSIEKKLITIVKRIATTKTKNSLKFIVTISVTNPVREGFCKIRLRTDFRCGTGAIMTGCSS